MLICQQIFGYGQQTQLRWVGPTRTQAVHQVVFFFLLICLHRHPVCDRHWNLSFSHSPGWQLLLVESSQSFGRTLDHLPLAHACQGLMPVCSVDVGHAVLQNLTHCNNQTWPAQAVVRRSQGLSLQRGRLQISLMRCWRFSAKIKPSSHYCTLLSKLLDHCAVHTTWLVVLWILQWFSVQTSQLIDKMDHTLQDSSSGEASV